MPIVKPWPCPGFFIIHTPALYKMPHKRYLSGSIVLQYPDLCPENPPLRHHKMLPETIRGTPASTILAEAEKEIQKK